jgi:predicted nucleic acid-binding protein
MLNLIDSSGWVEYLTKGKNGPVYFPIIQDTANLIVPTIVIYEVFKRVASQFGIETALEATGVLSSGKEAVIDRTIAIDAAKISLDFKLAMADSLILATAQAYDAILWTQDAHFKDFPGVRYFEK